MPPALRLLAASAVAVLILIAPAGAGAQSDDKNRAVLYDTFLVSQSSDGGYPNGASRNASLSQDGRLARAITFESDASNIIGGDTNGFTDVFVIERDRKSTRLNSSHSSPSRMPSSA